MPSSSLIFAKSSYYIVGKLILQEADWNNLSFNSVNVFAPSIKGIEFTIKISITAWFEENFWKFHNIVIDLPEREENIW